jgi:quercetin dioxygenase-like cupin family protein
MATQNNLRHQPRGQTTGNPVRAAQRLINDTLLFDLEAEARQLKREPIWDRNARNGKTLAKEGRLRLTLTALKPGATMPDEHVDGRMVVQVIEGMIILRTPERTAEMTPGRIAVVDSGIPWGIEAALESVVLLTICWPDEDEG